MHSKTEITNTDGSKVTPQEDESSKVNFLSFFGITLEQQKLFERERTNDEAAEQRILQNMQAFQREPEKWKQIQIVALDIQIKFYLINPSILHQDKWVVERKGFSTSIDVPRDQYDAIVEALNSHQSILKVNGRWLESVLYPGLERGGARFATAS